MSFFRRAGLPLLSLFLSAAAFAQSADLAVSKTGPASGEQGSNITYTVIATNLGPDAAASVTLTDDIPGDLQFVGATQDGGPAFVCTNSPADTITCTSASLGAGVSATFSFEFQIVAEGPFTNVVSIDSATPDPNPANDSAEATTDTHFADLSVLKTGPDSATAGSDVTYTVVVTNNGPDESFSVVVTDQIPEGMTFVSATEPAGFDCSDPGVGNEGDVICSAASLAAGASATFTFVFNIHGETPPGTSFTNFVGVTSLTKDSNAENDGASVVTTVPGPPPADMGVIKTGPAATGPDTDVTYTITLTNAGPATATNVTLEDVLPGNATFVSLEASGTSMNCTTPAIGAGGTVTCDAASFPANGTTTLTLTIHIPPEAQSGTTYGNTVVVTSANDPNEENNVSGTLTTVSVADVSVLKTGDAAVLAGANASYVITVSNAGPDDAFAVTLTDQLPPNTTLASFAQNSGPPASCAFPAPGTTGTVSCTIDLPSSTSAQFTLQLVPGDTTGFTNTATVTTPFNFDGDTDDHTSSVNTTVTPQANLAVTKSGPATVTAGTDVTYTITVTNNGPSTASSVSLTDDVPANTTFVSVTQTSGTAFSCGHAAGTVTCTVSSLPPGATATFDLIVHVTPGATGTIDNTADVAAATADPAAGNNTSNVSSTVTTSADLAVVKSGPAAATPGTNITYTVTATNNGPSTSTNVTLTDVLPPGTTFVSANQDSGPAFTCGEAAGTMTCTIASFAPATPATFTFVFAIAPGAVGAIDNTATIASASTPDPTTANNTSTTSANLGATADLGVTKAGPAAVTAGSNLTYTVTATNAGPSAATSVTLTDTLPSNATFVSVEQTSGPTFDCTQPPGQVMCTIASFSPAATATFTIIANANPDASGAVENTVTIASSTDDPNAANNTATSTAGIDAGPTDLSITKSANGTQFNAGSTVTYTVVVTNNGPGVAFGTTVTDILPPGTALQSATPTQGTCTGTTTVVCNLGTLAPSASATITLLVTVPVSQGEISNTASVTAVNAETNPANNASTAALAVVSQIPSLSEYGLMLLAAMLAIAGLMTMRR